MASVGPMGALRKSLTGREIASCKYQRAGTHLGARVEAGLGGGGLQQLKALAQVALLPGQLLRLQLRQRRLRSRNPQP